MSLRIGEVAARVGTTTRTIRYYEEIGLLPVEEDRAAGQHRLYDERDVDRLRDALRLKGLLGVSLDELGELLELEEAREARRTEFRDERTPAIRRREIARQGLFNVERQLELLRARRDEIEHLEAELEGRRARIREALGELGGG
jgi:DNA-binding transcriptional MerR regulator